MKMILSTTHLDSHGDIIAKEALEKSISQINGESKLRWTINHKRDIPPLGRIDNAHLEEKNGHHYLIAEGLKFTNREEIEWDNTLVRESFDEAFPFIEINKQSSEEFRIGFDKNNFSSIEQFKELQEEISNSLDGNVVFFNSGRKSEILTPELLITISKYGILYFLLKPLVEKIGEKIGEDIYDEIKIELKKFKTHLLKIVKSTRNKILPKNKKLVILIDIPGTPHIELFARADEASMIAKSLSEKSLREVREEIFKMCSHFEVAKIQFILSNTGTWKFNYLLTDDGEAIGKKKSFKDRDKQYQRVTFGKDKVGVSIGFNSAD